MRNREITQPALLLGPSGRPIQSGYSKKPLIKYNRENIRSPRLRVKEWNYLLVSNKEYALAFTVSDLGYATMGSASVIDLRSGLKQTKTSMGLPVKDFFMPDTPDSGKAIFHAKNFYIADEVEDGVRLLRCVIRDFHNGDDLQAYIKLGPLPEETMNIIVPWKDKNCFYFNQKANLIQAEGFFVFDGVRHKISRSNSLATLDWGRGVWPYHTHWFWATGNDYVNGEAVGLNLGYGFGDLSSASENAIYYKNKMHKLDDVTFVRPATDPMEPWIITSSDGRIEGLFTPMIDRADKINYAIIFSDQHQYFGTFTGKILLDDGEVLELEDFHMSLEDIRHRW